jgi:hypothetical protein
MINNRVVEHSAVENVEVDLVNVFMDMNKQELNNKAKNKIKKRLEARRGIEQHFENKRLRNAIKEFWEDI